MKTKLPVGVTWGRRPDNFAVGAIGPIAPMGSAPMRWMTLVVTVDKLKGVVV